MNFLPRYCVAVALMLFFGSVLVFAAPTDENHVIVPSTAGAKSAEPTSAGGAGVATAGIVILLAAAGGWMLWRNRNGAISLNKGQRQLAIEETRSLGNRQFLVVAGYQDKKFLLGVCPGKIELLAPLHDGGAGMPKASELK